jgi:hypothetical protein
MSCNVTPVSSIVFFCHSSAAVKLVNAFVAVFFVKGM